MTRILLITITTLATLIITLGGAATAAAHSGDTAPRHDVPQFRGCDVPFGSAWNGRSDVASVQYSVPFLVYSSKYEDVWFRAIAARQFNGQWSFAYGDWMTRPTSPYGFTAGSWTYPYTPSLELVVYRNVRYTFGYQLWWPSYGYHSQWSNETFTCT